MTPNARYEAILQKALIQDSVDRYTMFLNTRDWPAFESLLRKDFVFDCSEPIVFRYEGRENFLRMLMGSANYRHGFVFQMPHGLVVDALEGGQARTRHTLHIKATGMEMFGIYYDHLVVEDDGVWRFARRDFRITYYDGAEAPGRIHRAFPDQDKPEWYFTERSLP